MNIQTEHLENQLVRLTVTIDKGRLDDAKQKAARKIANQIRIPGFRKGKVPYHILVKNGLEGEILNQAIENLSQDIYREALQANSHLDPYGPGTFEDFKLETDPVFVYTLPLQPVAQLSDYRAIRRDYTAPEVTDEMVERSLKRLQEDEAEAVESTEPAVLGNRVTIDLHSNFADDPKPLQADATDAEAEDVDAEAEDERPPKGSQFAHEHGAQITLNPEDDPILPGFVQKLVGASAGDELEFELTVPEDDPAYEDIAGRLVKFNVLVEKVEVITLPELNDEFAQKVSEDDPEGQLQTLDELKAKLHESIKTQLERQAKQAFVEGVIDEIVESSTVSFPDAMLEDQIEDKIASFKNRLQQQGIGFDMYMRVMNITEETLQEQYREPAIEDVKRIVVLRELLKKERISATDADVQAKIDEMLLPFAGNQELRKLFENNQTRISVLNEVLQERLYDRIFDIATGKPLPELSDVEGDVEASVTGDNSDSGESQSETSA